MPDPRIPLDGPDVVVSDAALQQAEEFVEAEEGATNRLHGWLGRFVLAVAVVMSAFHLYTAYAIVPTQTSSPPRVSQRPGERDNATTTTSVEASR